jgi:AsmA protein
MRKLLIGLGAVLLLIVAAVAAVPYLVDLEGYRGRIAALVRDATGRDFAIEGPVRLSLWPRPALQVETVSLANAPGGQAPALASLGRLDLVLEPLPLLSGEIAVDRLTLVEPVIALEQDAQGRPNWRLGQPAEGTPPQQEPAAGGEPAQGGGLPSIGLESVEIVDGVVSFRDARSGLAREIRDLDAHLSMPSFDAPAALSATFVHADRPVEASLDLSAVRPLIEGGEAAVKLDLRAEPLAAAFDGTLASGAAPSARGALSLSTPDAAAAAAWLGAAGVPPGPMKLDGRIEAAADRVSLTDAVVAAMEETARGNVAVGLAGPRPAIAGRLALGRLDLDRHLPPSQDAAAPPAGTPPARSPDAGGGEVPIDLSFLRAADADLTLDLAGLVFRGVEAGPTTITLAVQGGRLDLGFADTAVFDGTVSGRLRLDGAADLPAGALDMRVAGVQVAPLLTGLGTADRLTGTARGTASLSSAGATVDAMLAALDGQGSVILTDGALKGINIAALVRDALATIRGGARTAENEPQQTDFAELGASFLIEDGLARTDDLRLLAPLLRLAGAGTVDIPGRAVDMRLEPRLVAALEGQGGQEDLSGLTVPVLVRGTFDALTFTPDVAGLARNALENPGEVRRQVEGLRDAIEGGQAEDAVKGLLDNLLKR